MCSSDLGATSGAEFSTPPLVGAMDSGGNIVSTVTGSVTITVSAGATIFGPTSATFDGYGSARFSGTGITAAPGTYTLTFSKSGLASATQTITVP